MSPGTFSLKFKIVDPSTHLQPSCALDHTPVEQGVPLHARVAPCLLEQLE